MLMTTPKNALDPVCGMTVDPKTTPHRHEHHGDTYYFCSGGCRTKFAADPEKYLHHRRARRPRNAGRHHLHLPDAPGDAAGRPRLLPDLRHGAGAGDCRPPTAGPNPELADMTPAVLDRARARRCRSSSSTWAATCSASITCIGPALSNWLQLALATPVVLWAGWPFFVRGWQSLVTRNLNMFTLIALGTGVAWPTASSRRSRPASFPPAFAARTARSRSISRRRR